MTALAELSYSLLHRFTTISLLLSGEGHLSCFLVTVTLCVGRIKLLYVFIKRLRAHMWFSRVVALFGIHTPQ